MPGLRGVGNKLEKAFFWFNRKASNLAMIVLMAMGLLVVTDVILRRLFNSPISWTLEVIEVMLTVVVFFTVAYCAVTRGHISVDVLTSRLPPKGRAIVNVIGCFLGIILFGFMTWCSIRSAIEDLASHRTTGIVHIPIYPFVFVVAFGSILLVLVLLAQLLHSFSKVVHK
jgi:TRAP-type C4-dicarboxylate transport system permease small subunit